MMSPVGAAKIKPLIPVLLADQRFEDPGILRLPVRVLLAIDAGAFAAKIDIEVLAQQVAGAKKLLGLT